MTKLLEEAIEKISQLPDEQQDAMASLVLEEISAERKWDDLFSNSQDVLASLAEEALMDFEAGKTKTFP